MKTLLILILISGCGTQQLIEDGTYKVTVTYDIDLCRCDSLQDTSEVQEWTFNNESVQLFAGEYWYDLNQEHNYLVNRQDNFYMELHPFTKHKGFVGYWRSIIPNLMETQAGVLGKKE